MGRVRAKGKKLIVTNHDDHGSDGDEKIPAQKRRGRPQKSLKDEIDEVEAQKVDDEDSEDTTGLPNKDAATNKAGKKRKRNGQAMEKVDSVKEVNGNGSKSSTEENANGSKSSTEETVKSNGFRQSGNRRKNKPHRAAEAVVECN
ncbi:hypothetical protein ACS0TY_025130 [Phlomoides rotata]